jgi:predicted nuclease of predicted toxin-antitoxin system
MKILLDENLSPTLVQKLATLGIAAQHVAHLGKSGLSDTALWRHAYEHDQVVVTINAADFLRLAVASQLHAGLIVLRAQGLTREQQWEWIEPVVERLLESNDDLVNRSVEITGPGKFVIRKLPHTE